MTNSVASTIPACPTCGSSMRAIDGSRGKFWGCSRYRDGCRGTRPYSLQTEIATNPPPPTQRAAVESPGPSGDLISDLRAAGGHIGRAIDLLRRHQDKINELIKAEDVSF